jgi:hypothetical protein
MVVRGRDFETESDCARAGLKSCFSVVPGKLVVISIDDYSR